MFADSASHYTTLHHRSPFSHQLGSLLSPSMRSLIPCECLEEAKTSSLLSLPFFFQSQIYQPPPTGSTVTIFPFSIHHLPHMYPMCYPITRGHTSPRSFAFFSASPYQFPLFFGLQRLQDLMFHVQQSLDVHLTRQTLKQISSSTRSSQSQCNFHCCDIQTDSFVATTSGSTGGSLL